MHRHEIEIENLERDLAHEETSKRAEIDRRHAEDKEAAISKAARPAPSGGRPPIHIPSHDQHIDHRVAEISKLRDKHTERRREMREKHRSELDKARRVAPNSAKHEPQREPLPHQGHAYVIWKDLDSARQEAMRGVFRSTAMLRDKADANVLDLSRSTGGNRYMQPGARMAGDANERHEKAHLDISRKEQRELDGLASRFEDEIAAERRRIHRQAVERGELERRQHEENRRAG